MASARWSGYYNRGPYRLLYTIQETLETPFRYGTPYFEKATPIAAAHSNRLPSRDPIISQKAHIRKKWNRTIQRERQGGKKLRTQS
ncbi:hypothetical protein H4Q26_004041 [Puccinia striiformis f. sp. tritici PST-130]|nr:hypothetical protein H4Q26_004041 [Puccinia striiformis f. sp. tritici PST-130]